MKRAFGCDLISTVGFLLWGEFSHKDSYHRAYRAACVFGLLQMAKTAMEIKNAMNRHSNGKCFTLISVGRGSSPT